MRIRPLQEELQRLLRLRVGLRGEHVTPAVAKLAEFYAAHLAAA
ncbi:hypothetical protein ABIA31_007427 [Catenulispora sp. MAP5-51]